MGWLVYVVKSMMIVSDETDKMIDRTLKSSLFDPLQFEFNIDNNSQNN